MRENTKREIKVGAMIALGLIIVFSAFFVIGGKEGIFSKRYKLYARFNSIEGLNIGAPVRLGGWKVGTVDDIHFTDDAKGEAIIVQMSISSKSFIRIREDSRARLGSMGLLGDRTVDISLGSPEKKPIAPGGYVLVEGGDVLKDVEDIASNAKDISRKINEGKGSLAQIINDPRLYTNLDSLLMIWAELSQKINEGEGNLAAIVNDSTLYNNLVNFLSQSSAFMDAINSGEGTLGKLAKDGQLYDRTDSLLAALNNTLEKINEGQGTLGQLMVNQELYERLSNTLNSLDSLLIDIREHPKRYVKISLF
jgi:phospholipid/cholesterol/gamma-HCH transport system substrate-binding protein